jgi:hypothetical protein
MPEMALHVASSHVHGHAEAWLFPIEKYGFVRIVGRQEVD